MARIIIEIPDVVVLRLRAAFSPMDVTPQRPATSEEFIQAIKSYLKTRLVNYEANLAAQETAEKVYKEVLGLED